PTRALRDEINAAVRQQLLAEGVVHGPARQGEKLISRDLTRAQMARASNYNVGDTVIFSRPYKTLGAEKGDERRVAGIDRRWGTVHLEASGGERTPWRPSRLAGAKGGVEVYRSEAMELRAGDRVRFTRNDPGSGLANGEMATVESIDRDGVRFRVGNGSVTELGNGDPQLRHIDRAFAATVHAFQGRTVDRNISAMPAEHPRLTDQRAFYVAISRARESAVLVTDDAHRLADQLERATGERLAALDATAKRAAWEAVFGRDRDRDRGEDHLTRASDAKDLGRGIERDAGARLGGKSRDRSAGRGPTGRDAFTVDRGIDREPGHANGPGRDTGHDKATEPKRKTPDFDLGL
ncbi:MAG: hypothetical protein OXG72_17750, partial [Acidobacteria bacterium]|nr:hypothetical protein [Acidobacteriota bacterium]